MKNKYCIAVNEHTGEERLFLSLREAARFTDSDVASVVRRIRTNGATLTGYSFRYATDDDMQKYGVTIEADRPGIRGVVAVPKSGTIRTFQSIKSAAEAVGMREETVLRSLVYHTSIRGWTFYAVSELGKAPRYIRDEVNTLED